MRPVVFALVVFDKDLPALTDTVRQGGNAPCMGPWVEQFWLEVGVRAVGQDDTVRPTGANGDLDALDGFGDKQAKFSVECIKINDPL